MVGLVHIRRWKKGNSSNIYWRVVKVCVGSTQYGGIEAFCLLMYWNILSLKFIKILNNIKSLCISFMLNWFKYFEQKNHTIFIQKYFNTVRAKYVTGGRMFQYPILYTTIKKWQKNQNKHDLIKVQVDNLTQAN